MKKILIAAAVMAVLAAAFAVIFIATFNLNNYREAIAARLGAATGMRVEIRALSLKWVSRAVMGIEGLNVYPYGEDAPVLSLKRAEAALELMPLLGRRLHITSVSMEEPYLHIVRTREGRFEVLGFNSKPPSEGAGVSGKAGEAHRAAAAAPPLEFNIDSFDIKNGTLRFQDLMTDPSSDVTLRHVEASVKDMSIVRPVRFSVKMALAGERQNVEASGITGGFAQQKPFLKDFEARADLGAIGYGELISAVPQLKAIGLNGAVRGLIKAKVRELRFEDNKLSKISASATFTDGAVSMSQLNSPVENVNLEAAIEDSELTVSSFSLGLAGGSLKGNARISDVFSAPKTSLKMVSEVRGLKAFLSRAAAINQDIDGDVRFTFDGTMSGRSWEEISRTLSGGGHFTLERGAIVDSNMLRQSISALTIFPALVSLFENSAPPQVKQFLGPNYTILKPLSQSYTIEASYANIPGLVIESDVLDLRGEARISLAGDISGRGIIRFAPPVSQAMIASVPPMQYLADQQGRVEFPIAFKGGTEGFKVIPDMNYIAKKIAVQQTGEIVTDILSRSMKKEDASGQAAAESKPPKIKDILKGFLKEQE